MIAMEEKVKNYESMNGRGYSSQIRIRPLQEMRVGAHAQGLVVSNLLL